MKDPVVLGLISNMAPNVSLAPISKPLFTTLIRASGDVEVSVKLKLPRTSVVVEGSPESATPLLLISWNTVDPARYPSIKTPLIPSCASVTVT